MNKYEGMLLLKPDLTKEGLDKVLGQIRDIIGKNKGTLTEMKDWGKQKMAYPIKKYKEGAYYLLDFHIEPEAIQKIKRSFGLNEEILRVLITKR